MAQCYVAAVRLIVGASGWCFPLMAQRGVAAARHIAGFSVVRYEAAAPTHPRQTRACCVGLVAKPPLVCEAHLQAQLEGPAGNRGALVHDYMFGQ